MDTSLLISLSYQVAAYRSMDAIANNIANASTPAFQREQPTFQEYLVQTPPANGQPSQTLSFVQDTGVARDMTEGDLTTTNAPYDLAIHGKGYFAVQTPNGERYTRNGHFGLDSAGQLVTSSGYPVQGDGGAITITPDDGDISIAQDGTVSGKNGTIGKIKVVDFANPRNLVSEGGTLFDANGEQATAATDFTVNAGMLESSNVKPVIEISHMIEVMRAYQATSNLAQTQDDLLRNAINKLGSLPS